MPLVEWGREPFKTHIKELQKNVTYQRCPFTLAVLVKGDEGRSSYFLQNASPYKPILLLD